MIQIQRPQAAWPVWLGALFAAWLGLLMAFPISHNDTWWHLKCGEWLLQHRSFPAHDPFSYSSPDTTWLKASWLFEVLAWLCYTWGGATGLIAIKIALILAGALFMGRFAAKRGAAAWVGWGVIALGFAATRFMWTERPQTTAAISFMAVLAVLDGGKGWGRNAALLGLSVLWANLNGSVIVLPLFVLVWECGAWMEGRGFSWGAVLLSLAGTFISPQLGSEYLDAANFYGGKEAMRVLIREWKPEALSPASPLTWLYVLSLPVLALALLRRRWSVALLLAAALAGSLKLGRMAPFFSVAMGMWAPAILALRPFKIAEAVLAACLLGQGWWMLDKERLWVRPIDTQEFPVQAAEFLAAEPPVGHLGNLYLDGSYLLFRLGPQTPVFIDSREFNYPEKIFRAAYSLQVGSPVWTKIAEDFKFSCMLLPRRSGLFRLMLADPHWKLVYFDQDFAIASTEAELKAHQGRWPSYPGVDLPNMALAKPTAAATAALEQRMKSQPRDAQGFYLLGLEYAAQKRWPDARIMMNQALQLDPKQTLISESLSRLPK